MRKKALMMIGLFLFSLFFFPASSGAGQFLSRLARTSASGGENSRASSSLRKTLSSLKQRLTWRQPDNAQPDSNSVAAPAAWINRTPLSGRQILDKEASVHWMRDQINAVLDKLAAEGFNLPTDIDQKLDSFFATALDYLMKDERQAALPINLLNSLLEKGPDYDLSWNYDPKTGLVDFMANRILGNEQTITEVDLAGKINLDGPSSPWNLTFLVQNATLGRKGEDNNKGKGYFQRAFSRWDQAENSSSAKTSSSPSPKDLQDYQAEQLWRIRHNSTFTLSGEICQDGLVSLYLHPCQTIQISLQDQAAYATVAGIEVWQQSESRTGKMYLDIIDQSVSGADDKLLYHWEWPLP